MYGQQDMLAATPSAFFAAPPPAVAERIQKQPECRLLWAVLENAVDTYMKHVTATGRRGRRLFREAEDWIWREDPTRFVALSASAILSESIRIICGKGYGNGVTLARRPPSNRRRKKLFTCRNLAAAALESSPAGGKLKRFGFSSFLPSFC